MQGLVTRFNFTNFLKKKILWLMLIIFILFIILIVIVGLKTKDREELCFNEKKLYIVYVDKNLKQSEVLKNQKRIKSLGGAGEVLFYKDLYYLVTSVYLYKNDAMEVVSNINKDFEKSDILSLTVKKIPREKKNIIKKNQECLKFFKLIDEFNMEFNEQHIMFLAGKINLTTLSNKIIEYKIKLDEIIKNYVTNDSEFYNKILTYEHTCLLYFNNFLNVFFESTKKDCLVCEFAYNMSLLQFEMASNL